MTDPMAGTRAFRAATAAAALAAYEAWLQSDAHERLSPSVLGDLAACTRWLAEMTAVTPAAEAAELRRTGQANTAVAGLSARQLRDVLYALAADSPRQVLAAIAEAGL